ncbi:MAG: hypothetical protein FWF46_06775, partial [Oscillospiraceae bacterium]|nr:hypothetical protein [Oscillospiraceae bacterium]
VSSSDKAKLQQAINMLQAIKNKCTSPSTIQSQSDPVSQVQDAIARLNAIDNEIDSQWYNQLNYGVYSFTSGFGSSLATNLAGQPTLGNDYGNKKNTYYAGALAGDITSTVVGGLQIVGGIGLIISGGAMIAGGGIVTGTGEGAILGVPAAQDYANKANEFYKNRNNYQVKIDENGIIRVYDSETNTFGSYNSNGTTKTLFKPDKGQLYFDNQSGNLQQEVK